MKISIFFDYVDFKEDSEFFERSVNIVREKFPEEKIVTVYSSAPNQFEENLLGADIAFLDFGGLDLAGSTGMFDSTKRYIVRLLEEKPSIQFVFILTMGKEWYSTEEDTFWDLPNVDTVGRGKILPYLLEEAKKTFSKKLS